MRKINYLVLLGITIPLITNAQEVITTSGGSMADNTVQANWTIGEPITETASNNNAVVTSGFNQPVLTIVSSIENIQTKVELSIFPNPTSQIVNIKYSGQLPVEAKVLSVNGQILSNKKINEASSQLDFSSNAKGIYLIEITEQSGKSNTYRIVKQ
jgi:hypothetical protein